jgi:hypothetical protein
MRTVVVLAILSLLIPATTAFGGANYQGRAWLSWNANWTNPVSDLTSMPTGTQFIYVQLGELNELAGCEFELRWYPPGPAFSACYEFSVGSHPSGSGTNCSWLMRGGQVEGLNMADDDEWNVAFAGDECNTVCSSGNVARALFDFSFCFQDIPGYFCLEYVKVTDCAAVIDILVVIDDARILGGPGHDYPCSFEPTTLEETTWGAIKSLYQ